ncbi:MAG: translation initiation factor IF-2 [bacterium]
MAICSFHSFKKQKLGARGSEGEYLMKVFELAKELSIPSKDLMERVNGMGIKVSSHFQGLQDDQANAIRAHYLEVSPEGGSSSKKEAKSKKPDSQVKTETGVIRKIRKRKTPTPIVSKSDETQKVVAEETPAKTQEPKTQEKTETLKAPTEAPEAKTQEKTVKEPLKENKTLKPEATNTKKVVTKAKAGEKQVVTHKNNLEEKPVSGKSNNNQKENNRTNNKDTKVQVQKKSRPDSNQPKVQVQKKSRPDSNQPKVQVQKKSRPDSNQPRVQVQKKSRPDSNQPRVQVQKKSRPDSNQPKVQIKSKSDTAKEATKTAAAKTAAAVVKKKRYTNDAPGNRGPNPSYKKPVKKEDGNQTPLAATEAAKAAAAAQKKKPKIYIQDDEAPKTYGDNVKGFSKKKANKSKQYKYERGNRSFNKRNKKKEAPHVFNPRKKDFKLTTENITVGDFAGLIGVKAADIIKTLMGLEMMVTITQTIDTETALLVASEFGIDLKIQVASLEEDIQQETDSDDSLVERPPVITIMGHVDHGKTSLLDKIREADVNVTTGEAGGITQHIGAYHVGTKHGDLTFLDTPGHEAFTEMRARGANCTDIVILVVSADDGPKPQTIEAIDHAKAADVPIIVAVNKCDKPDATPEKTMQKLMEHGLLAEEYGGDITMVRVSAITGLGVDDLLERIALQAEIMELKANPNKLANGVVIESKVDKARGHLATVLVQGGTLKVGDNIVIGSQYGRIRAMSDENGKSLKEASPSTPVEILGINGVPNSGDLFNIAKDERQVRLLAEERQQKALAKIHANTKIVNLENIFDTIKEGERKNLNLLVKTDVIGSLEALSASLLKLGNEEVAVKIVHGGVGAISQSDISLAAVSSSIVIGFNVRPEINAKRVASQEGVDTRIYSVIYDAIDDVTKALEGLLDPIIREVIQGKAEVQEVFGIPKIGLIAGSRVIDGKILRNSRTRVLRNNVVIWDGDISSLKRFKDNVKEVSTGFECGIGLDAFKDIKVGDLFESYIRVEEAAKL